MSINIGDNFSYLGKKFLDNREHFETVAEMKACNDVPNGFITYCDETNTRYEYHSDNEEDTTLGKWRVFKSVPDVNFDEYVTQDELDEAIKDVDVTEQLENYATKTYVASEIAKAQLEGEEIDLSGFATKDDLPTKTSELTNDSGFITIEDVPVLEIPEEYVTEDEIVNFVEVQDTNDVIDDVETNTYVKYVAQTLTEEQKAQVRENIGVGEGTVTGVKINGTTKNPSNGVVDLGTVITSHQDISGKQDKLVSGTNIKTINGTSILGSGNITIEGGSGSSDANVQAVDTNDVLDDVNVDYATTAYVDGLVGDINSVLETIINGGVTPTIITFTIAGSDYQAEEGMTFYDWGMSKYYDSSINLRTDLENTFREGCELHGNTSTECMNMAGLGYTPTILLNSVIQPITYTVAEPT